MPARRPTDADERLRYELEVVDADRLRQLHPHRARDRACSPAAQGIRMGVRGSAAASLILYCLGVTDIDPLKRQPGLRALPQPRAPARRPTSTSTSPTTAATRCCASPPNRYGADRVAQIITFGTLGAKAADPRRRPRPGHDLRRHRPRRAPDPQRAAHDARPRAERERGAARRLRGRRAGAQPGRLRRSSSRASRATPAPTPPASSSAREPLVEHLPLARPARGDAPGACRRRSTRWSRSRRSACSRWTSSASPT